MSLVNLSAKNASRQRIYQRRNRTKNRAPTLERFLFTSIPTANLIVNDTSLLNGSAMPINDLFAPISILARYKFVLLIGLSLLILLCILSIVFLIILSKRSGSKTINHRRPKGISKKKLAALPDFLDEPLRTIDDTEDNQNENSTLIDSKRTNSIMNGTIGTPSIVTSSDNISNTFSLGPMLEEKIRLNNPPTAGSIPLPTDAASIDTLRGSMASSPSQRASTGNAIVTTTQTASTIEPPVPVEEPAAAAEKDDDLHELDFRLIQPRYIKANNNGNGGLLAQRTSDSSLQKSILRQEKRAEEDEHEFLHGSKSNLYEKELKQQAEKEAFARKEHTTSQASLTSRTSEDSCY